MGIVFTVAALRPVVYLHKTMVHVTINNEDTPTIFSPFMTLLTLILTNELEMFKTVRLCYTIQNGRSSSRSLLGTE